MRVIKCIEIKKSNINDQMCWKWTIYTRVLPINPYMNGLYCIVVKKMLIQILIQRVNCLKNTEVTKILAWDC